jgi:hypothetical protein
MQLRRDIFSLLFFGQGRLRHVPVLGYLPEHLRRVVEDLNRLHAYSCVDARDGDSLNVNGTVMCGDVDFFVFAVGGRERLVGDRRKGRKSEASGRNERMNEENMRLG